MIQSLIIRIVFVQNDLVQIEIELFQVVVKERNDNIIYHRTSFTNLIFLSLSLLIIRSFSRFTQLLRSRTSTTIYSSQELFEIYNFFNLFETLLSIIVETKTKLVLNICVSRFFLYTIGAFLFSSKKTFSQTSHLL